MPTALVKFVVVLVHLQVVPVIRLLARATNVPSLQSLHQSLSLCSFLLQQYYDRTSNLSTFDLYVIMEYIRKCPQYVLYKMDMSAHLIALQSPILTSSFGECSFCSSSDWKMQHISLDTCKYHIPHPSSSWHCMSLSTPSPFCKKKSNVFCKPCCKFVLCNCSPRCSKNA